MQIIDDNLEIAPMPCVASIGFFDGVHKGHHFLISQVLREAKERKLNAAVLTFPVHPGKVIYPELELNLLTLLDEKLELLGRTDLDSCFLVNFTRSLSKLTAYDFMKKILKDQFNVQVLIIGYDHRFGHNRAEGFEDYCKYGSELGIEVIQAEAFYDKQVDVSSSSIREAIALGDISLANQYLGYRYFIDGEVIQGKKLGRTIGFPTANVQLPCKEKMLPKDGVYAVKVLIDGQAQEYWGMLNIGLRPTVDCDNNRSIEVNILDFNSDIYGRNIRICFFKRLRDEIKFDTLDDLIKQLHKDEKTVRILAK